MILRNWFQSSGKAKSIDYFKVFVKKLHKIHINSVKYAEIRDFSGQHSSLYSIGMRENTDKKTPNTDIFHTAILPSVFRTLLNIKI